MADELVYRHFVRVDDTGRVVQDLEAGRTEEDWKTPGLIPESLIDVTGHPQWEGLGSLIDTHMEADGSFAAPKAPARVVKDLSPLAFARLFTFEERMAIRRRRAVGDAPAVALDDFYELLQLAGSVSLADPMVLRGIPMLVALKLITESRAAEILSGTPVQD